MENQIRVIRGFNFSSLAAATVYHSRIDYER
jgi:hypothetical protein